MWIIVTFHPPVSPWWSQCPQSDRSSNLFPLFSICSARRARRGDLPFEHQIGRCARHLVERFATDRTGGIHSEVRGYTRLQIKIFSDQLYHPFIYCAFHVSWLQVMFALKLFGMKLRPGCLCVSVCWPKLVNPISNWSCELHKTVLRATISCLL